MSTPNGDLENKLEAAQKAVFADAAGLPAFDITLADDENGVAGVYLYTGQENADHKLPSVTSHCTRGSEDIPNSGNYRVSLRAIIRSNSDDGDDPLAAHRALVAAVSDTLVVQEFAALLNAAALAAGDPLTVFENSFSLRGEVSNSVTAHGWETVIQQDFVACASVLA